MTCPRCGRSVVPSSFRRPDTCAPPERRACSRQYADVRRELQRRAAAKAARADQRNTTTIYAARLRDALDRTTRDTDETRFWRRELVRCDRILAALDERDERDEPVTRPDAWLANHPDIGRTLDRR